MSAVLILGYGNTLRGDDGLGWRAAEMLAHEGLPRDVRVVSVYQLSPELADPISQAKAVLFVDATRQGRPGDMREWRVRDGNSDAGFTHQFTPATLLELTRKLYGARPIAYEVSLCGECFDLKEELSPRIREEMPMFVRVIREMAEELTARNSH